MDLRGQGKERGYAMAALLVSLAVMSILMSVLLPVWRQQSQREKEAELAFRGEQYARAIYLYQRRFQTGPPNIDVLVQQRFLRKKYQDPMTKDGEFQLVYAGANQPGMTTGPAGTTTGPAGTNAPQTGGPGTAFGGRSGQLPTGNPFGTAAGGAQIAGAPILGVMSKSKESSIRIYRGATHYNEWRFVYNAPGRGGPNQQGAPGMGPRGQPQPGGSPIFGPGGPGRGPGRGGFPGGGPGGGIAPGRGPGGFGPQPQGGRPPGQ